jgi:hypothetical protein
LAEAVRVIAGCFADQPFSHAGAYYTIQDLNLLPKPIQRTEGMATDEPARRPPAGEEEEAESDEDVWTSAPAVEAHWRPLLDPGHPMNRLRREQGWADDEEGEGFPYYWSGMSPAQLAAVFDRPPCPGIRGVHNARPRHQWFLDPLGETFPGVTFHGVVHHRLGNFQVEGFQLIAPPARALELQAWLKRQKMPATAQHADEWRKERDPIAVRPDDWGLHRHDDGLWHFWWWWD